MSTYFRTFWRSLKKHKIQSTINIGGLGVGFAACILIMVFVKFETSYDDWLPDSDRLYAVQTTYNKPGADPVETAFTPALASENLKKYFSTIEETTRIFTQYATIDHKDQSLVEPINYVDPSFFTLFDLPMISGDREKGSSDSSSILISEKIADQYFSHSSPIGEVLNINKNNVFADNLTIVGVFKSLPENSHLQLDFVAYYDPAKFNFNPRGKDWDITYDYTYIMLKEGVEAKNVEAGLKDFVNQYANMPFFDTPEIKISDALVFNLLPVTDIHLHSKPNYDFTPLGDARTYTALFITAILILLVAVINYTNLATARSLQRAREVSMRKVLGASRGQLIQQFLGESLFTAVLALVFAVTLVEISLPIYSNFVQKELTLNLFNGTWYSVTIIALGLLVGFIGGIYPAFFLSSFRPAKTLKSNQSAQQSSGTFRNLLVVAQFAISIGLIVATLIIHNQTQYAKNIDTGFERDQKLMISGWPLEARPHNNVIRERLRRIPGVKNVAQSLAGMPRSYENSIIIDVVGTENYRAITLEDNTVGPNFFPLFNVEPVAGRLFTEDYQGDFKIVPEDPSQPITQAAIINEAAVRSAGYFSADAAIGQTLIKQSDHKIHFTIVGVIPDIIVRSVHQNTKPAIYPLGRNTENDRLDDYMGWIIVDIKGSNISETLAEIDQMWQEIVQIVPIYRVFVDTEFQALYTAEERLGTTFMVFAILAIFLSCVGLYALAAFTAECKTKEIGVRKVFGAGIFDIVQQLGADFSRLILWASLIAWPVSWYYMHDWLSGFEHRIGLEVYHFALVSLSVLLIAWAIIAKHVFVVATANPIDALKCE